MISLFRHQLYVHLIAFGFYLLMALLITWPLVTVMSTRMAGFGYSDAYEMGHHIWWFKHALQTGQPLFYQSMMGYPDGIEGITLWAHPLQFFPAWLLAFVLPLPVAYNLMLLVSLALNGWAMYWLANYLLEGNRESALLAGLVYMTFPTMQGHLGAGHAGLLVQWPVPLYVYTLFRLRDSGERKWILLGALLFFLSATGHTLQIIYVLLPITALFWLALLVRREFRALARVTMAAGLGVVALGLFLIPIARATLDTSAYSDAGGAVRYSADLLAFATPSFLHPLFGNFEYTHRVLGINIDEGYLYVGIIAALLAAVAVWKIRAARWWLLLAGVVYLLALGPLLKVFDQPVSISVGGYETGIPLPGALLDSLPLFSLARTPGRYGFTLALALAALAGYGFAHLWPRLRNARWIVLGAAMALILFEYQAFWPLPSVPAAVPEAISALRERDDLRAVFDVPYDNLVVAKEGLYLQTEHQHPLIAGQVTRSTPVDPAKLTILQETLDPALLREAGTDIIIVHREYDSDDVLFERARNQLGEPMFEAERFGIFLTPQTEDTPIFTALPSTQTEIRNRADSYFYAPQSGWMLFSTALEADQRDAVLYLDESPIHRWTLNGSQPINVPLALDVGYHNVTLAVEPSCPRVFGEALRCRTLAVSDLMVGDFTPQAFEPVAYGRSVTLAASRVEAPQSSQLPVWLWWQFGEALTTNDIRFVHVLNLEGHLVAQSDVTLGDMREGEARTEIVTLTLPEDLPAGAYRVYTGWYTFPDTVRFPVLSEVQGEENGFAQIGEFTIGN